MARATISNASDPLPAQPSFARTPFVRTEPLSPERRAILEGNINKLPHHPATPEGLAAYKQQLLHWVRTHGLQTRVSEATPVPLTPGTVIAGSNECFTCGQVGHSGANRACPSYGTPQQIPRKEADWRRIVFVNRRANPPPAATFYVAYDDPFALAAAELENQGKGDGSSA